MISEIVEKIRKCYGTVEDEIKRQEKKLAK